mgnify:CR=1 FL=1
MEPESRVGGIVREEGQVRGSVAEVKSERIVLRGSREQNGTVAFAQVTKRHHRWAVIGNAADAPLDVAACPRSGVNVGGSVVEEIGLAGTRVPKGGEEGGDNSELDVNGARCASATYESALFVVAELGVAERPRPAEFLSTLAKPSASERRWGQTTIWRSRSAKKRAP